jgi:hypothetical protein
MISTIKYFIFSFSTVSGFFGIYIFFAIGDDDEIISNGKSLFTAFVDTRFELKMMCGDVGLYWNSLLKIY